MSLKQYKALIYKNWILWKRCFFGSFCEIFFPLLIFVIIAGMRAVIVAEEKEEKSYLDEAVYIKPYSSLGVSFDFIEGDSFKMCSDYIEEGGEWTIGLAPYTDITTYLASKLAEHPNLSGATISYFDGNDEINDYITDDDYEDVPKLCFAIVFESYENLNYEYYIRFNQTDSIPEENQPVGDFVDVFYFEQYDATDELIREPKTEFQEQFIESGFSLIQNWVDNYILQEIVGDESAYIAAAFVPMYYDEWIDDDFLPSIKDNLSLIIILAYLIPLCRMIALIVQEKEYKIKEMMTMMGLSNTIYWLSWITYYSILYFVIGFIGTSILCFRTFNYSNTFFVFVLFVLFGWSCMAFALLVSVFFSRAKSALTLGLMLFIGTFFVVFAVDDPNLDQSQKNAASLIPSVAFSLGIGVMVEYEMGQEGIHGNNLGNEIINYRYRTALVFLLIDIAYLLLLAIYLENVWPTDWGTKKPWYFLFTKSFWSGEDSQSSEDFETDYEYGDNFEPVDASLEEQRRNEKCIKIRNLTKEFEGFRAVNNLNLDIYEGQIFALLGHNGAGKTTTISMLTGLIPQTSGDVKFGRYLLSKNLDKIRKKLGVCPQQNVLFNELTPEEHLYIYSVFKGMTDDKVIKEKIEEKLKEVNLIPQRQRPSEFLSGGQKRKLSLAIAMIADSKIILLDEPTSGMDLTARRLMWDMLKDNKSGRIIILTTHYMQEADILADRIVIMSHGNVRCCGSSLFLKNRYGVGYYLTIVKEPNVDSDDHTRMVEDFVKGFIPEARISRNIHAEMNFQIPATSSPLFQDFFQALDQEKNNLQILTYAISVTTLEEVFIRVARGDEEMDLIDEEEKERQLEEEVREDHRLVDTERQTEGLFWRHMVALLVKRFRITSRDFKSMAFEILVPLILVLLGISFMLIADRYVDADPYELTITKYEEPQDILYSDLQNSVIEELMDVLESDEDITTTEIEETSIENFDEKMFDMRDNDPYRMGSYYFYEMSDTSHQYEPVIFHNQTAYQSLATYYQLISLTILQSLNPDVNIKVYNYPFPITQKVTETENTASGVFAALIFGLGFSFIPGAIIAYIVKDREDSVKHQHTITGVSLWGYWISNYLWDFTKYIPVFILTGLLIMAFDVDAFLDPSENLTSVWLLLLFFGTAIIAFTYSTSYLFKDYSSAQVVTIIFHFITGSMLPIINYILFVFDFSRPFVKKFRWICRLFPNYCLGNGFLYTASTQAMATLDGKVDPFEALELDSAGGDILMLIIDSILYLIILTILEWIETTPSLRSLGKPSDVPVSDYKVDDDVEAEEAKALNTDPDDVQVNIRKLRQVYGGWLRPSVVAVESVSFNVQKRECFALLGVNGAGKTSTFRMLTGEYAPTSGEAYLGGYNVISNLEKARENIGYCPQFDALSELMSCEEHIKFYCEVKGISEEKIEHLIRDLLTELDLIQYRKKLAGTLSGGNKRKLSVAIALIGNPTVIFLDEPSAGMDPETRKKLWRVLGNIKKRNSAVVLTTHSMEEAEALCDRMSIMVGGRLRCIGTSTYLRDKFGQGFEIVLKLKTTKKEKIQEESSKLQPIIGDSNEITENNYKECLEILGAEYLIEEIKPKGAGLGIYNQLKGDKVVNRDLLVSWVITERKGKIISDWLKDNLEDVTLIEHYLGLFRFKTAKREDKSLGYLFSLVESNKKNMKISEYSISPTTLDQIFSSFAVEGTGLAGLERDSN